MERLISALGLLTLLGIGYALSSNRKQIRWRTVIVGVSLQLFLGLIILKTEFGFLAFEKARAVFVSLLDFTNKGSDFIFGPMISVEKMGGFVFFTMVLPTILFMSALMSVMYHLGVMQKVVEISAKVMMKLMKTSGAESLSAAANVFAGQTEAPLVVKPFISKMTESELLSLMTGGMATVAGGVLVAYVGLGVDAAHLLAASVMSAPAALVCAKLLLPETKTPETAGVAKIQDEKKYVNIIEAAASGAGEGLQLALNVGGMLLAFIALIALINGILGWVGGMVGYPALSFEIIIGYIFSPLAFMLGVPWEDCINVGVLLGKKTVINEFVAYLDLTAFIKEGTLSDRAVTISTYALCGFSNFSSIAIQIGGIGTLAPERKTDLAKLGIKSLIGGTLACFMTASIAGIFL